MLSLVRKSHTPKQTDKIYAVLLEDVLMVSIMYAPKEAAWEAFMATHK